MLYFRNPDTIKMLKDLNIKSFLNAFYLLKAGLSLKKKRKKIASSLIMNF